MYIAPLSSSVISPESSWGVTLAENRLTSHSLITGYYGKPLYPISEATCITVQGTFNILWTTPA